LFLFDQQYLVPWRLRLARCSVRQQQHPHATSYERQPVLSSQKQQHQFLPMEARSSAPPELC
jgi:hypothetical protein